MNLLVWSQAAPGPRLGQTEPEWENKGGAQGDGWPGPQHCVDLGKLPRQGLTPLGEISASFQPPATIRWTRVALHLPGTVARPEEWVCARVSQAKANSRGTRLPRSSPGSTGFQTVPSTLGPNCRGVLALLPSREQPPNYDAAAPARP